MKKMSKILCSVLVMCGAFSMSAMSVYATGDILIDEPMEMEEAVTTIHQRLSKVENFPLLTRIR